MPNVTYFSSESVCAGHPDKIADAISDAILDEALRQDPSSRTGIESVVGANQISIFGEINSHADLDIETIARSTVQRLGYTDKKWNFSAEGSTFSNFLHQQSPEIAIGVDKDGAGDQGMMFGYACDQTDILLPLPIALAHAIAAKIDAARESGEVEWLRPDGKAQVTVRYEDGKSVAIEKLVCAVAHHEDVAPQEVRSQIIESILQPVVRSFGFQLPGEADIVINGTGVWHIPGPDSDAGLTGRKIVVDGYGGYARVGGGAFSGKDPSKVDRSGAYAARYIAKNIVAAGYAREAEVALAYVIGQPQPLMKTITLTDIIGTHTQSEIENFGNSLLDTSVHGITEHLDLRKPIYAQTVAYGHFGKDGLPWERVNV